jgi:outer membrane protein assembly factor BamB
MSEEQYYLHRDGKGRFLLQRADTGIVEGLLFPAMPGESARAFSYDYGSVWYPHQLLNLADFPELADMPFFTIESCAPYQLSHYFQQPEFQSLWPLLGSFARFVGFSLDPDRGSSATQGRTERIVWQYKVPNPKGSWTIPILDLWVNEQGCWFCTREGEVVALNHQGEPIQHYALPKLTRCLAGCEDVPYVSCDDGNLYDLSAKVPQAIYAVRPASDYSYTHQILAVEQTPQALLMADAYGHLQLLNADLELQWQQHRANYWQSGFLRSDLETAYLGHYRGVSAYHLTTGQEKWRQPLAAPVLCGRLTQQEVIVGCSDRHIYGLQKTADPQTGEIPIRTIYACAGMPYVLTLAADEQSFFVGDYTGKIEQLDWEGNLKAEIQLQAGAITALKGWGDRLYATTSQGLLICLDRAE